METGFKAFDIGLRCRGFQYEVGQTYEMVETPRLCLNGFHFSKSVSDCFKYYGARSDMSQVCEVAALGEIDRGDDKLCTNKIHILRELSWTEIYKLINVGEFNKGRENHGNFNVGIGNLGSNNIGHYNRGDYNVGSNIVGSFNILDNYSSCYTSNTLKFHGYFNYFCNRDSRNVRCFNMPMNDLPFKTYALIQELAQVCAGAYSKSRKKVYLRDRPITRRRIHNLINLIGDHFDPKLFYTTTGLRLTTFKSKVSYKERDMAVSKIEEATNYTTKYV